MYNLKITFLYCVFGSKNGIFFPLEAANTCNLGIHCRELVLLCIIQEFNNM